MKKLIYLIAAVAAVSIVAFLSARVMNAQEGATKKAATKSATTTLTHAQALKAHTTSGTTGITSPVKLCSGLLDGRWRDSIAVSDSWTVGACQTFASSIGTDTYQLGCIDANGVSWGAGNNSNPPTGNSCHW